MRFAHHVTIPASPTSPADQKGVALVIALILLVVISLVGIAAVRGTIMQQRMTGNFYDRQLAFQAAEAALREAESAVQASTTTAAFRDCSSTSNTACIANPFSTTTASNYIKSTTSYNGGTPSAGTPQYVIEYMGRFDVPDPNIKQISNCTGYPGCGATNTASFYRITARSAPATVTDRAVVTLQSMYRK